MKAVVYENHRLNLREIEKPSPEGNEVLVKVHTTSLNAADYRSMSLGIVKSGWIPGADVAGVVEAVGGSACKFKPGDKVVAELLGFGSGGLAEYVKAPERAFVKIPEGVSFDDAASLPIAALTALQALRDKGGVKPGDRVLIVGSGGGVGTFAIELAKLFGAEVTAVCGAHNVEQSRNLGADIVIDYKKGSFTKSGNRYNIILAVNGNYPITAYRRALVPGGRCVVIGGAFRQIIRTMLLGWFMSAGGREFSMLMAKPLPEDMEYLLKLVQEGKLRPIIERRYALSEGVEAMRYIARGHSTGKVLVKVGEQNS